MLQKNIMMVIRKLVLVLFLGLLASCTERNISNISPSIPEYRYFSYHFETGGKGYDYTLRFFNENYLEKEINFKISSDVQYSLFDELSSVLLYGPGGLIKVDLEGMTYSIIQNKPASAACFGIDNDIFYIENVGFKNEKYSSILYRYLNEEQLYLTEINYPICSLKLYKNELYVLTLPILDTDPTFLLKYDTNGNLLYEIELTDFGELEILKERIYLKTMNYLYDLNSQTFIEYGYELFSPYSYVNFINEGIETMEWNYDERKCIYRSNSNERIFNNCYGYQPIDENELLIYEKNKLYLFNSSINSYEVINVDNDIWKATFFRYKNLMK